MTRFLPIVAIAIVISLVAIPLLALSTGAQDETPPTISLSPAFGPPGTEVTVYGYNFAANQWVDVYYYLHTTDRIRVGEVETTSAAISFTVTFTAPESYKGDHEVLADGQYDVAYKYFSVRSGLTVTPEEGPVGATVTVEGRGFGRNEGGIEITFGGQVVAEDVEADPMGSWEETIEVPSASGGRHTIRAEGDAGSVGTANFDVKPGISIDESLGAPGQVITMTGTAFADDERHIKILFDGEELVTDIRADERGYWQELFEVPELPAGDYTVTADGDRTKSTDIVALSFEIRPGLVLSPATGHVGMNLTVTGRGFAPDEDVVVLYDDSEVQATTTDDEGSFEVSFEVPESRHGEQQVTAEDTSGNEAAAAFTMESDPPGTPELLSPPDEGRAGFVGKARPRFEWSEVPDDSGVYYRLQISASANVTDEGELVDPIVSKELLTAGNYTLDKTEALPHGTYYWIVQAIDRAENAGNWTAPYSFRAGLLPMWAFIVIIVFVALLVGGLVYHFVVRRRMYL
ncbi:MAG: IPT/TIG domain-containing protein [Dehalococcoidia bacterium]